MSFSIRNAALALALVCLFGATPRVGAASLDDGPEYIKLQDPMFLKFMDIKDGSHVLLEGLVGSIQASHSSYSRNTFFVKVLHLVYILNTRSTCSQSIRCLCT